MGRDDQLIVISKHYDNFKNYALASDAYKYIAFSGSPILTEKIWVRGAETGRSSKQFMSSLTIGDIGIYDKGRFQIFFNQPSMLSQQWSYLPNVTVLAPNLHSYQQAADKFNFYSWIVKYGNSAIKEVMLNQISQFNIHFRVGRPKPNDRKISSSQKGEGGSSYQSSAPKDCDSVYRTSSFCNYEVGLIMQSVAYQDGCIHGPVGRVWSGHEENPYRNSCIYYDPNVENMIDLDRMYQLQTDVFCLLREMKFTGAFSTDWLYTTNGGKFYFLEVNPRFSSDVCLFDQSYKNNGIQNQIAVNHQMSTSESFLGRRIEIVSFCEFGGSEEFRAYFPLERTHENHNFALNMSRRVPEYLLDFHTNHMLLHLSET